MLKIETLCDLEPGRIWSIAEMPSAATIRAASAADPKAGYWRGNYYVTRYRGTREEKKSQRWLLHSEVDDILRSRIAVAELTGTDDPEWTYPALSRQVIQWTGIQQRKIHTAQLLIPEWHYQYCLPCITNDAAIYDMTAAYWQCAARARSPIFDLIDGKIIWRSLTIEQQEKWDRVREQLAPYKKLRLALIGACAAGWNRSRQNWHGADHWRGGEPRHCGAPPSALQPLALLSVRSTYELTQIQSDLAESIYSNADCCTTETCSKMEYWDYCGVDYKLRARGPGEIRAVGAWNIGGTHTKTYEMYADADRWQPDLDPHRVDDTRWHKQMLCIH